MVTERTDSTDVPLDHGQGTWDQLAARVEALIQRWESGDSAPVLAEYMPPGPPALRRLALVELIKVDLDYRSQRKQARRIEDYVSEFPELAADGVPCDLIFEEFQVRRRAGEPVDPREYFNRFPGRSDELARLLQISAPTEVSLSHRRHPEANVAVGDRLDDFDLQALLGEGAFAKVFLAWQRSMQRRVALKVSADKGDEPQTLAQLDHPHIVRVYDQRQIADRNLRLLYMPYLPGGTLQDVLRLLRTTPLELRNGKLLLDAVDTSLRKRGEPIPTDSANRRRLSTMSWPEAVCYLGARMAEALDYAHRQGVLHRDVKPANVLLGADATPHLADFNVGTCNKLEGASPSAFFGGSLPYMSPEQIEAFNPSHPRGPETLDGRCDIYSLAVTLWELLTGQRPFPDEKLEGDWGDTLETLLIRRKAGIDALAQSKLPAEMPPGLREVLLKCLEAEPDLRYRSAGELANQLDLCLKPEARRLLYPGPGWRIWIRRHPVIGLYSLGLLPAVLASWFSIEYNKANIIDPLSAAAKSMFTLLQVIVNATFFPLGVLLFSAWFWPVVKGLREVREGMLTAETMADRRRQSLHVGTAAGLICLAGFVLAGVIFPVTLQLKGVSRIHFLFSQTVCGLIAFSYPFFIATFLVLRGLYPAYLPWLRLPPADAARLRRLDRRLNYNLVLTASVPLLAVGLLAVGGSLGITQHDNVALGVLSIGGIAGFGLAYYLLTQIRADINALMELTTSSGE